MAEETAFSTEGFNASDFDVTRWINGAMADAAAQRAAAHKEKEGSEEATPAEKPAFDEVEAHISGLLLRLQQDSQGLNAKLEEAMARLLSSIPRALREVDRIGRDSDALDKGLATLEAKVNKVAIPRKTEEVSTLDTLEHLHTIKTNLDSSIQVLEKSAAWDRLVEEVESSFTARDLVGVAERLGALRASLELLRSMPGEARREDTLHKMEQRLETLIGPGLRKAITECLNSERSDAADNASLAEVEQDLYSYVSIFEKLGRLDHLCKDFAEARASFFMEDWEAMAAEARDKGWTFGDWVSRFFEPFAGALERERARCERVFGVHAGGVLRRIAAEALTLVAPGFQQELSALSLQGTVEVFGKSRGFAGQLLAIADVRTPAEASSADDTAQSVEHLVECLLLPYRPFLDRYRELEASTLSQQLETQAGRVSEATLAGLLNDPAPIELVHGAVERCGQLSMGAKMPELVQAVDKFWSDFVTRCIHVLASSAADAAAEFQAAERSSEEHTLKALRHLQAVASFADRIDAYVRDRLAPAAAASCKRLSAALGPTPLSDGEALAAGEQHLARHLYALAADHSLLVSLEERPEEALDEIALKHTRERLAELVHTAQALVFDAMLAPVAHEWAALARMKVWAVRDDEDTAALPASEEGISEFGGPLKYMTRVTKHLVTLVELLEPFAAKSVSAHLLPNVDRLGAKDRLALEEHLGLEPNARLAVLGDLAPPPPAADDEDQDAFSPPWLSIVALGTTDALLLEVLQIPALGEKGARQLAADLGCLDNVLSMIAAQDPLLLCFQTALEQPLEALHAALESARTASDPPPQPDTTVQRLLAEKYAARKDAQVDKEEAPAAAEPTS